MPLFSKYCSQCHGTAAQEGDVNFSKYSTVESVLDDRATWNRVLKVLNTAAMPPEDQPKPAPAERQLILDWIKLTLQYDCTKVHDPGRVTLRRLNRAEYDNTLRDLLGVDLRLAQNFPADDVGEGFDNIGDVLSLPPLLLEKYLDAAEQASAQAGKLITVRPGDGKTPSQAATAVLKPFVTRAYRRPATADDLRPLVKLVETVIARGESYDRGIQAAVAATLVSPHFLYRLELDPAPEDSKQTRALSDYELATRLSYFLWSTMPDDELFGLAAKGELHRDDVLRRQVPRMLKDPKAEALIRNFGGQWLNLRLLDEATRDPRRFPGFDERLRRAMQRETELLFETVLREDRSVLDFLTADFTFVNEVLAKHYGLPPRIQGDQFQRVTLSGTPRRGVLTQASILTLTSNPSRTSPVKRGKWILENILGTPPPEPPANVPPLEATQKATPNATLREQMVLHRKDPVCASCHRMMDDLGFGFENFDAVGRWRDRENDRPIDAAGELPSGERFTGAAELIRILGQRREEFARALTRKMLVYALGRGLQYYDQCTVDRVVAELKQNGDRFSVLIAGIVTSEPFRMRRGDGGVK
jgi:hypothetical protein